MDSFLPVLAVLSRVLMMFAPAFLVPLAWSFANPAGPVQDEAFERIAALICARLSEACGPVRAR